MDFTKFDNAVEKNQLQKQIEDAIAEKIISLRGQKISAIRLSAADGKVYTSSDGTYFTTLSLWDTFRAAQPWYTVAMPEIVGPVINSFLSHYRTFGRLPVMSYGGHNVDCMIGNHSVPVIADA